MFYHEKLKDNLSINLKKEEINHKKYVSEVTFDFTWLL